MLISTPRIPNKPDTVQKLHQLLVLTGSTLRIDPSAELAVGLILVGNTRGSVFLLVSNEAFVHIDPWSVIDNFPLETDGLQQLDSFGRELAVSVERPLVVNPPT